MSISGFDAIRGMFDGTMPCPGMVLHMGMRGTGCGEGWVTFEGEPGPEHYNPAGTVHGGYAATMLDSAMGCAVMTTLAAGIGFTTIDLNVTYLRAMTGTTGTVTARGEVITSGRRIATARGEIIDSQGKLIATAITTCLVFPIDGA